MIDARALFDADERRALVAEAIEGVLAVHYLPAEA